MLISEGTEAIVAMEDREPDVLFSTFPGTDVHLWPYLRMLVAQALEEVVLNNLAVRTSVSRVELISRMVTGLLPSRYSPSRINGTSPLLHIVTGGTRYQAPHGRRNWLVDPFAEAFPDSSLVLQDLPLSKAPAAGRPTFAKTFSFDGPANQVEIAAKFSPLSPSDLNFTREVVQRVVGELAYPIDAARVASIEQALNFRLRRVRHLNKRYAKLIERTQPAIALVEDASYGTRAGLIRMLKEQGTLVVEPQHGWIGPSHGAYNFGSAMGRPELRQYQPDVLLTFGEFWSTSVRHPAETVAIGKPYLEEASIAIPRRRESSDEVIVASSVYDTPGIIRSTLALRESLPREWKVRFRPHPAERAQKEQIYSELVGRAGIEFDDATDVYESLASARAVFGFASTVLYEALSFDCQPFVLDSPLADLYVPTEIFGPRVASDADISRAVATIISGESPLTSERRSQSIWKPNAVENFRQFVRERLPELGVGQPAIRTDTPWSDK